MVRTATAYLELAKVRHSLDLMRSEEASGEKILQVVRERVAANQELPIEGTRSQLALARIQERIVKLEDRDETLDAADPRPDWHSRRSVSSGRSRRPHIYAQLSTDVAAVQSESQWLALPCKMTAPWRKPRTNARRENRFSGARI